PGKAPQREGETAAGDERRDAGRPSGGRGDAAEPAQHAGLPARGQREREHDPGAAGREDEAEERGHHDPEETSAASAARPTATSRPCSIAIGGGGLPGTSTSTGSSLATPFPPTKLSAKTPPDSAHAPTATTRFGVGIAS